MSYIDTTCSDDVTSSELVNGGTIHDTVSIKTLTLLGEGAAGVGRNVWWERVGLQQALHIVSFCNSPIVSAPK